QAAYLHGRAILTSRATLSRAPAPVVRYPPSRRARRAERRSSGPSYGRPRARRLAPRPRAHGSGSARRASTTRTPGAPSRARWPRAASRPGAHAPGPAGPASPGASPSRPRDRRPRGAGPRLRRACARLALPRLARSGAGCRPALPSNRPWPSSACRAALRDDRHPAARRDADRLGVLRDTLTTAKVGYWAEQVDIQRQIALAWVARAERKHDEAVALLRAAADREDAREKHPVTPGPLAPARELLAEMLLEANEPVKALQEFESSMRVEPNRFRGLAGAARAAELAGDRT